MAYAIIGSHALGHLGFTRTPKDFDIIATFDEAKAYMERNKCVRIYPINGGKTLVGYAKTIIEASIAWPNTTNAEFLKKLNGRIWPTADEMLTLKLSHRYLRNSPHFYKTMRDIKELRAAGAEIFDYEFLRNREKETYDYKHPSLNQSKEGFFSGDSVIYKYDHDSIHEAVAIINHTPMYKSYLVDEVTCDKDKWLTLSTSFKKMAVAEECAVLALERSIIPFPGKMSGYEAYKLALMKVYTSITSGWFREFAWENHVEILDFYHSYQYDYIRMFEEGLKKGVVKSV